MGILQQCPDIDIVYVNGHYSAYLNGEFLVSGDTLKEVCEDLTEMGYIK